MRNYYNKIRIFALSGTAKDTYLLFISNTLSAFLGFLFTLLIARGLSVADFGVFSAANNLIFIIASLTDIGISSGLTNFVARHLAKGEKEKADEYIKAGFLTRFIVVASLSLLIAVIPGFVSGKFLATSDSSIAVWVSIISLGLFSWVFFPFVFKAKKQFIRSAITENSLGIARVLLIFILTFGGLNFTKVFTSFALSTIVALVVIVILIGTQFLRSKPSGKVYKDLFMFSGWMGVNNVLSSISGRLDIQMLAALAGATATGLYSIPQRLSFFIGVLAASFISVISPRMASFNDKEKEKKYMLKATLGIIPISAGILSWILLAQPFILILFGAKYLPAVPVFQLLAGSMIPFLFTVPPVGAIIYAMQKPIFVGVFAIFQLAVVFLLNSLFIPRFGPFGPTYTFMIINTISVIYFWTIAIRYYWGKDNN